MNIRFRFLIIMLLLAGAGTYMGFHRDLVVPLGRPFEEFPVSHAGWRMTGQASLGENIIKVLMPTDYLSRRYANADGASVDMYLSFFNGAPGAGRIHSPKHCLPGGGWTEISSRHTTMELDGEAVNLVRAVYAMGNNREVIYYWFSMRGRTMADEFSLKFAEITGSMFHRRRDQSFMKISVQGDVGQEEAEKQIEDFLRDFYPVIRDFLPN
jgi:EpsI family protein